LKNDYHENYVPGCASKPATNVFETEKDFQIEVLLPGFSKKEVQLTVQNNLLTIKAGKNTEEETAEYKYEHREFGSQEFEKQYRLPKTVNSDEIKAKFEDGVLKLELPKKEEALEKDPLEIEIS
jgi:HSP20 family protein